MFCAFMFLKFNKKYIKGLKVSIYIFYPSGFFPPFWLDIDHPKEIDITEPDG
jgi:hypothetical protein